MILIMTASIKAAEISQLSLTDTETRRKQYCYALQFYIQCKQFDKIVFCDNSNYFYEFDKEQKLAREKKVQLEILKFDSDYVSVEKYGKGYGEGEILKYVIEHSKLLEAEDFFYKVTGRLVVKNIAALVRKSSETALFNRNLYEYQSLDTRFWGMKKKEYIEVLSESHKNVNDERGRYLEMCYKKDIEKASVVYKSFCAFPVIDGYSGTAGIQYAETRWYTKPVYDFLCRYNLYNSEKGFFLVSLLFHTTIHKRKLTDIYYEYLIYNMN